jgi:membrane AbrB-like protein
MCLTFTRFFNIPGGAFIGAVTGAAIVRLSWKKARIPPKALQFLARTILGLAIGIPVNKQALETASSASIPIILMIAGLIGFCFFSAWLANRISGLDIATAFCGSSPGAATTMVILAEDLGGQTPIVTILHTFRILLIVILMPICLNIFQPAGGHPAVTGAVPAGASAALSFPEYHAKLALLIAGGLLAAFLFRKWKVPAAEIMGGILVAAVCNPLFLHLDIYPRLWQPFATWIVGTGIGCRITKESLRAIRRYIPVCSLLTLLLLTTGFLLGGLLYIITPLDLPTALLGTSPGGLDAIILLAGDINAQVPLVATMHTVRQILIMLTMPFIIRKIVKKNTKKEEPK